MNSWIIYALCKKYTQKSLTGLGALKGSPCKIKNVIPVYSTEDPSVVLKNKVTLEWDSNNVPSGSPIWHEETVDILDNGRGIYKIDINESKSTAEATWYTITFYDGTTDEFPIPTSSGSLKKKVVTVLPTAAAADKNAIYLVPVSDKPGSYQQWLAVENDASHIWEWLSLGTTDVDLSNYQLKEDPNILKIYPNYDPATKGTKPNSRNVVGAINEHEKVIGATYDYTNNKISNLTTHKKTTLVDAINEMGNLEDLEIWDSATQKPSTLVEAINFANEEYTIEKDTTVDRTKFISTLKMKKDNEDGTPIIQKGDTIEIPRVDIKQQATPEESASFVDYRTYNLYEANALKDPNDSSNTPYGAIHIPRIKLAKKVPIETETRVQNIDVAASDWDTSTSPYTATLILSATPQSINSVKNGTTNIVYVWTSGKTLTIKNSSAAAMTVSVSYEVQTLAAQYYLEIEGKTYSQPVCGVTIDIAKDQLFKDIIIIANTADNVPVPGLHTGEKSICFVFEDPSGAEKKTYLPVKDIIKPFTAKDGLEIDDSTSADTQYIYIKLDDPETLEALKVSEDGLRIMKADTTQYGVVKFATDAEILTPASSTEKTVKPYDLYNFILNSTSFKNDLQGFYHASGTTDILNNTLIKAINELASIRVKEKDHSSVAQENITEYNVETLPTTGVENYLGDTIKIPKPIMEVEALSLVAPAKREKYLLYYLTEEDPPYKPGLYKYVVGEFSAEWVKVSGGAIEYVEELPTAASAEEDHFYGIANTETVDSRYRLSDLAKNAGYTMSTAGLKDPMGNVLTWASVYSSWSSFINDEIVADINGDLYLVKDKNNVKRLEYGYQDYTLKLWFFKDGEQYQMFEPAAISIPFIDSLDTID